MAMTTTTTATHTIDPERALEELRWLGPAVGTDPERYGLVKIHVDGPRSVATDGHRLHYVEGTCFPVGFSVRGTEIARILDLARDYSLQAVGMRDGSTHWRFESPDGTCDLALRIPDAPFPDYRALLPDSPAVDALAKDLRKTFSATPVANGPDYCVIGPGHFNARYVADALRGAPKTVQVQPGADRDTPVVIRYANRVALIMPVRQ